jgi:hypothetical protein
MAPNAEGFEKKGFTPAEFAARKRYAIDLITENYSHDLLPVDEYEKRVERAQTARSVEELEALTSDLPATRLESSSDGGTAFPGSTAAKNPRYRPDLNLSFGEGTIPHVCILSGRDMSGEQLAAKRQAFVNIMGGTKLDFRNTRLEPGETKIEVFCFMGGLDIIVPPGLAVRSRVVPIMGGVDLKRNVKRDPYPGEPYLTIEGFCLMGGVDVKSRD